MWMRRNQEQWSNLSWREKGHLFCQHHRQGDKGRFRYKWMEFYKQFILDDLNMPSKIRDRNICRITEVTHQRFIKGLLCSPWQPWGFVDLTVTVIWKLYLIYYIILFNALLFRYEAEHNSIYPTLLTSIHAIILGK